MGNIKKDLFSEGFLPAIYFLAQQAESVDLKKFVVGVVAEVIFRCKWEDDIKNNHDRIALLIKKYCDKARKYNVLKKYERESLKQLIDTEWNLIGFERCLPSNFANGSWAYDYNVDEGQLNLIKFKERIKAYKDSTKKEFPVTYGICGTKTYCVVDSVTPTAEKSEESECFKIKKERNASPTSSKKSEVNREKNEMRDKLLSLYNDLVESRGGEDAVREFEYIWQWRISKNEYQNIKEILISERCKQHICSICESNVNCRFIVVTYIAENYKREWNGYNGNDNVNDNVLEQIGFNGNNGSSSIARTYFGEDNPIIFQHDSGTHEWLDTLRMEGGLPIYHIQEKSKINDINNVYVRFAETLYNDSSKAINILANKFHNEAIKYSYSKGYSLGVYLETLLTRGLEGVCCTEDINNGIFQEFRILLENGRMNARRNSKKFAYKYRIWKFQDEFLIHRCIVFKEDRSFNEKQDLISRERLKEWGVGQLETNDIFWLKVDGRKYEFHPWGKDYYRSDVGLTEFPLSTARPPLYSAMAEESSIYYVGKDGKEIKINSIVVQDKKYIKFTSENGFDWLTGRSDEFSSVLLIKKVDLEVENSEVILQYGDTLRWVEFSNRIKIDGKDVYSSRRDVYPEDEAIHPIVKQKYIRSISYCKDDEECDILLLDSSKVKAGNFIILSQDGESKIDAKKIRYKDINTDSWKEYKGGDSPCGLTKLNIDGLMLTAYILPHDAKIDRDLDDQKIILSNIDGSIESEECELIQTEYKLILKDKYNEEDEKNKERDNIIIKIKISDDEYIALEIIRPLRREDKMLGQHIISADKRIPRKLESRYRRRRFDDNGVSYQDDRSSQYEYSSEITHSQKCYYIAKGLSPKVEENLEFVFISDDLKEYPLTLSTKTIREGAKDISYIYFDKIPQNQRGVIIQTLQNKIPDLTYYKPKWIGMSVVDFGVSTALERLKISNKHKLYSYELICRDKEKHGRDEITPELLIEYFANHYFECEEEQKTCDWKMLWEVVNDLKKDWLFIPRVVWRKFATDETKKQLVNTLFLHRPESKSEVFATFIELYWDLKWTPIQGGRNSAYKFMKSILDETNNIWIETDLFSYKEKKKPERNIEMLKKELDRLINI